jgi:Na+/phosphate symporter
MLAIVAAAVFALALILDWANTKVSDAFTPQTLLFVGLLCLALHLAGVGTTAPAWRGRRRRL